MRVRALDATHQWLYGKGANDYLRNNAAIVQDIDTRLSSFVGNCFFDLTAGLDWLNLLGSKNQLSLTLAIQACLINTTGVTGILQLAVNLDDETRNITVQYQVQTVYSVTGSTFIFNSNAIG